MNEMYDQFLLLKNQLLENEKIKMLCHNYSVKSVTPIKNKIVIKFNNIDDYILVSKYFKCNGCIICLMDSEEKPTHEDIDYIASNFDPKLFYNGDKYIDKINIVYATQQSKRPSCVLELIDGTLLSLTYNWPVGLHQLQIIVEYCDVL